MVSINTIAILLLACRVKRRKFPPEDRVHHRNFSKNFQHYAQYPKKANFDFCGINFASCGIDRQKSVPSFYDSYTI